MKDNVIERFRKRRADRLAIAAYRQRRDERMKRYDAEDKPADAPEEREDPKNNGNTRLPYGLCKKNGIDLPKGATPHDAWQALKGKGITPPWDGGEGGEKAKEQLPNYSEGETPKESVAQPKNGIKTPTEGTEAPTQKSFEDLENAEAGTWFNIKWGDKSATIEKQENGKYKNVAVKNAKELDVKDIIGVMEKGDYEITPNESKEIPLHNKNFNDINGELEKMPEGTKFKIKDDAYWEKEADGWYLKVEGMDKKKTVSEEVAWDIKEHGLEPIEPEEIPWEVPEEELESAVAEGVETEMQESKIPEAEQPSINTELSEALAKADELTHKEMTELLKNAPAGTVLWTGDDSITKKDNGKWEDEIGNVFDNDAMADIAADFVFEDNPLTIKGQEFKETEGTGTKTEKSATEELNETLGQANLMKASTLIDVLEKAPVGTMIDNGTKTFTKITEDTWQKSNGLKVSSNGMANIADDAADGGNPFSVVGNTAEKSANGTTSKPSLEEALGNYNTSLTTLENLFKDAPAGTKLEKGEAKFVKQKGGGWKDEEGFVYSDGDAADYVWSKGGYKVAGNTKTSTPTDVKNAVADLNKQVDDAYKSLADYNPAFVENILKQMPDGAVVEKKTPWGKETYTKKNGMFVNNISKSVKNLSSALATLQSGNKIELYDKIPLDKKTLASATQQAYKSEDPKKIETHLNDAFGLVDDGSEIFANGYKWKKDGDDYINQTTGEAVSKDALAKEVASTNGYVDFEEKWGSFGDGTGKPAKGSIAGLKPTKNAFSKSAYSKERKDKAAWCKSLAEVKDLHSKSVKGTKEWMDSVGEEGKNLLYNYTSGSGNMNSSLRTKDGSPDGVHYPSEKSYQDAINLKKAIGKSHLQEDMWLQRGVKEGVGLYNFGISKEDFNKAMNGSVSDIEANLNKLFKGKTGHDAAFMSCGSGKGAGFSGRFVYNIYAPKGTSAVYAEPLSAFGHTEGGGKSWNGKYGEYNGSETDELETLLNAGTSFKCTGAKYNGGTIYLDVEVVGQDDPEAEPSFPHVKKT